MYKIGCPGFIAASINFLPRHGWTAEDIEAPVCLKLKKGGNGGHAGDRGGQRRWSSTPAFDLRHSASLSLTHTHTHTHVQTIRWRKSTLSFYIFAKLETWKLTSLQNRDSIFHFARERHLVEWQFAERRSGKLWPKLTICGPGLCFVQFIFQFVMWRGRK